jgi:phosphoribosylamine--glycine ligase
MVNVLLIGNGAREHAIAESILKSSHKPNLYAYLSQVNPGIVDLSKTHAQGEYSDLEEIVKYAKAEKVDFSIIGPEEPLKFGVVDALLAAGIKSFGPGKEQAQLETSKGWTRYLQKKYKVGGQVEHRTFASIDGIEEYLMTLENGSVLKPDVLTSGKGVRIEGEHYNSIDEALKYCREVLDDPDQEKIVIEEKLEGEEFSLQCITDGKTVYITPPVQDHKREGVGDTGKNTGGMGSYSNGKLLPFMKRHHLSTASRITEAMAEAIYKETGARYKGVMYGGFIITRDGVKLIEYNARFGDPEAMNILPLMKTDMVDLCQAVINGKLKKHKLRFKDKATVCKYVVPLGYPSNPITGPLTIENLPDNARLYFGSVVRNGSGYSMTGSRAVGILGIANNLSEAEPIAEKGARAIEGLVYHRFDIGTFELIQKRLNHMSEILK